SAIEIRQRRDPTNEIAVAASIQELATLCRIDWKLADAERLYMRVLEIRERVLGPDHPAVAETLLNLERTYLGLGNHGEADRVHRRAATIVTV
ncbi:MAG TPA: tetratricopeptide repeat protein, partial [Candidatus Limnocylindria bacterium]